MTVRDASQALPYVREQIKHEQACCRSHEEVARHFRTVTPVNHDEIARLAESRQPHRDRLERLWAREKYLIGVICGEEE